MSIYLASQKPSLHRPADLLWQIPVLLRTRGWYAHSALIFGEPGKNAICFSANRPQGVAFGSCDTTDGSWDHIKLTMTEQQEAYAQNLASELTGSGYGIDDIKKYLWPAETDNIDTYDCSNVVATILSRDSYPLGVSEKNCWLLSPSRLHEIALGVEERYRTLAKENTRS